MGLRQHPFFEVGGVEAMRLHHTGKQPSNY